MTSSPLHDRKPPSLMEREWPAIAVAGALVAGMAWAVPFLSQRWVEAAPHRAHLAAVREARAAEEEARLQARLPVAVNPDEVDDSPRVRPDLSPPKDAPVVRYPAFISQPSFELPASVGQRTRGIIWVYFDCKVTTRGRLTECDITESPAGSGAAAYMRTQLHQVRVSPMTVDGEPRETRMNFSIRFNASRSGGTPPSTSNPPRSSAPPPSSSSAPPPAPVETSRIAESLRDRAAPPALPATEPPLQILPIE